MKLAKAKRAKRKAEAPRRSVIRVTHEHTLQRTAKRFLAAPQAFGAPSATARTSAASRRSSTVPLRQARADRRRAANLQELWEIRSGLRIAS